MIPRFISIGLTFLCVMFLFTTAAVSDVRTQFVPTLSITEEYTDNYNQTENNTDDEASTIYAPGFSFGVLGKHFEAFLNYNPEYTDYNEYDENDAWSHNVSLEAQYQISAHTTATFSESFIRDITRSVTTNSWEEHDTNVVEAGITHEFGARDVVSFSYAYELDNYDDRNADEYKTHHPSASLSYWFQPQLGLDMTASYEKTEYEVRTDEPETWAGDIRLIKNMTRHLDIYASYAHTFTDQDTGDHTVYHPSIGLDWRPTEDSGISIGMGILFHEWDNTSEDTENFFADIDVYRNFDFSRRGTFGITGSSGYEATGEDAASLGFHTYYEVGCLLTYALTRQLTGELSGTYTLDEYDDPTIDRQDNTLGLGAGLVWSPLQWLSINLSYEFTDFNTDDAAREDYQENVGTITITMTPSRPVRFGESNPRRDLETRLFD